jgi:hypothetical protein
LPGEDEGSGVPEDLPACAGEYMDGLASEPGLKSCEARGPAVVQCAWMRLAVVDARGREGLSVAALVGDCSARNEGGRKNGRDLRGATRRGGARSRGEGVCCCDGFASAESGISGSSP